MTHRVARFAALIATLISTVFLVTAAAAGPVSAAGLSDRHTTTRQPFGDYVGRLSFDVGAVSPALVTAGGPTRFTVTGTLTNTGPEAITGLIYRFHRGPALDDAAAVRQELAEPSEPSARVQEGFTAVGAPPASTLAAGESAPFRFTASITDGQGLAVTAPGVYPLMVNVNGGVVLPDGPVAARVGELHLLLTVMGVPGDAPAPGDTGPVTPTRSRPLPVNVVWPVVDQPHLGVGGVFLNENLLTDIAPGGRLTTLVNALTDSAASSLPLGSITVVLDPQLLDELDRMTRPYRVVADPGRPQPSVNDILRAAEAAAASTPSTPSAATSSATSAARPAPKRVVTAPALPSASAAAAVPAQPPGAASTSGAVIDNTNGPPATTPSTTSTDARSAGSDIPGTVSIPGTKAGTGQASAASFLEKLRDLAGRYPVVMLPYGDPDVVALTRQDLAGEVDAAVKLGTEVTRRVLGSAASLDTSTGYPINGAVDAAALSALRGAGLTTGVLAGSSVDPGSTTDGAAVVSANPGAVAADRLPSVITEADVLDSVRNLIDEGRQSGWATRVNALTGILAQRSLDSGAAPAVFTPARRWSPDASGLRVLTDLLTNLGKSRVIAGVPLTRIAGGASEAALTAYPQQAREQELPESYVRRISAERGRVTSLRRTMAATPQASNPELVLAPLDRALDTAASTAFRQDPAIGDANLSTVETTTEGIWQGVQILSAGNSYTLASSTSPLLLTVQNTLPWDVPVRVQISGGERVGLTVTDPVVQVVPAGRSQQVRIPAEVSRSGQFQVTAQLIGADGSVWGPPVELTVESTAYGALTVVIIVVAGGVLVLMVVLRIVQRLRARRARVAAAAAGLPADDGTDPAVGRDADDEPHIGLRAVLLADPAEKARAEETTVDQTDQVGTERS